MSKCHFCYHFAFGLPKNMKFTKASKKFCFDFTKRIPQMILRLWNAHDMTFPHFFSFWRAFGAPSAFFFIFSPFTALWRACGTPFPSFFHLRYACGPALLRRSFVGAIFLIGSDFGTFKKFFKLQSF